MASDPPPVAQLRDQRWLSCAKRVCLSWFVCADRDARRDRLLREVVKAAGAPALLAQAETGAHERFLDLTDAIELEHCEPKVVGGACAGQRLPEQAMLRLDRGQLGRVARKLRAPGGGTRRDADQVGVDEQVLARRDPLPDRCQVESIAGTAE